MWEASVVPLSTPGHLLMYGRTVTGWLYESRSTDAGATWSAPIETTIANPMAPACLIRVPRSEAILMFRNPFVDVKNGGWMLGIRRALSVQVSTDDGKTWGPCRQIEYIQKQKQLFDYPYGAWIDDTLIVCVRSGWWQTHSSAIYAYSWKRQEVMKWVAQASGK
jgi:hypothetical protein